MTKKYVKDMTKEELTKVYHANAKLREDVYDDMIETEMHYISDQLDYLKDGLSDWSIGAYERNYIYISNADNFINAVEEVEKAIPILIDSEQHILEKASELREEYRSKNVYDDNFDEVEEELNEVAEELADVITKRFTEILDYCGDQENQIDYFFEFYSTERLEGDECYINVDDGNYILYEDVTRSFN